MDCCLDHSEFPPSIYVDATRLNEEPNFCQMDTLCWTRYEKNIGQESLMMSQQQCNEDDVPPPSNLCSLVVEKWQYSDEDLQGWVDFIAGGCEWNDTEFESLLVQAHAECKAEIIAQESAGFKTFSSMGAFVLGHVLTSLYFISLTFM